MRDPLAGIDLPDRLARQLGFCLEIDRVKAIVRQNLIADGSRQEGDAEHQWHLAVMALVLAEWSATAIDVGRVIAMVLIHDLVEIDAGDAFVYDDAARAVAASKEPAEADRGAPTLWEAASRVLDQAVADGILAPPPVSPADRA